MKLVRFLGIKKLFSFGYFKILKKLKNSTTLIKGPRPKILFGRMVGM
jgi:hypothetical protein